MAKQYPEAVKFRLRVVLFSPHYFIEKIPFVIFTKSPLGGWKKYAILCQILPLTFCLCISRILSIHYDYHRVRMFT